MRNNCLLEAKLLCRERVLRSSQGKGFYSAFLCLVSTYNLCTYIPQHTITCGGGIGIFLVVTSTYIIVIRGRRACLWGSLYLDDFDEEDRDLKYDNQIKLGQLQVLTNLLFYFADGVNHCTSVRIASTY